MQDVDIVVLVSCIVIILSVGIFVVEYDHFFNRTFPVDRKRRRRIHVCDAGVQTDAGVMLTRVPIGKIVTFKCDTNGREVCMSRKEAWQREKILGNWKRLCLAQRRSVLLERVSLAYLCEKKPRNAFVSRQDRGMAYKLLTRYYGGSGD